MTTLTQRFEAVHVPWLIGFAERWIIRDRQAQLEAGMAHTLNAIKTTAESDTT